MKPIFLFCILFLSYMLFGCEEKAPQAVPPVASETPKAEAETVPESSMPAEPSLLSEYETEIYDKLQNRTTNLNLCAKALTDYVIQPGAEFSFNDTVGPRTPQRGYKKAITYDENGNKKKDYGGGICQVSSTLHMAAHQAGLEITERHTHKQEVPYEIAGNDAAVCYGVQDFKFINNQEQPVKIQVTINGMESVIVKLYKI